MHRSPSTEKSCAHPFYLQELVASQLSARGELPATVLALVQARIDALDSGARRLLRAGSVFGQTFWSAGVSRLLGDSVTVDGLLSSLCEQRLVIIDEATRFAGERQYEFRHSLIREGAYAMLTDEDRELAHRLAGAWLRECGETDASVLAEHFRSRRTAQRRHRLLFARLRRGAGDRRPGRGTGFGRARSGVWRAGSDAGAAAQRARRCVPLEGENSESAETCARALALLPRGSRRWFSVAGEAAASWGRLDQWPRVASLAEYLAQGYQSSERRNDWIMASAQVASQLLVGGQTTPGFELLAVVEREAGDIDSLAPLAAANVHLACATRLLVSAPGPGDMLAVLERCAAGSRMYLAKIQLLRGDALASERDARAAIAMLDEQASLMPHGMALVAGALLRQGRVAEACDTALAAVESMESRGAVEEGEAEIRLTLALALEARGERAWARQIIERAYSRVTELADSICDLRWRDSFLNRVSEHVAIAALHRLCRGTSPEPG